jgi:hypothetical protein
MPFFSIKKAMAQKADGTTRGKERQMNLPKPRLKGDVRYQYFCVKCDATAIEREMGSNLEEGIKSIVYFFLYVKDLLLK